MTGDEIDDEGDVLRMICGSDGEGGEEVGNTVHQFLN